ncbi:RnfH family protein [uncultured Sphaerotilus sp.]|uniref:RnfH family protein n=1 Tax=uncultured Sphaerotilus sp. TaxID=474984 RepID=UPI0030CA487D
MASAEAVEQGAQTIRVEVAYSPAPRQVDLQVFELPVGATAGEAVIAAGLPARHPGFDLETVKVAVWGRAVAPSAVLRDGDRLELCRPLIVDPKEARRVRYRAQGERGRQRVSGSRSR